MSHKRFKKIRKLMRKAENLQSLPDRSLAWRKNGNSRGGAIVNEVMTKRGMYLQLKNKLHEMGKTK